MFEFRAIPPKKEVIQPKIVKNFLSYQEILNARGEQLGLVVECENDETYSFVPDTVAKRSHKDCTVFSGSCFQTKGQEDEGYVFAAELLIIHPGGPDQDIIEEELHVKHWFYT